MPEHELQWEELDVFMSVYVYMPIGDRKKNGARNVPLETFTNPQPPWEFPNQHGETIRLSKIMFEIQKAVANMVALSFGIML